MNRPEKSFFRAEAPDWTAAALEARLRLSISALQDYAIAADAAAAIDPRSLEAMRELGLSTAPLAAEHGGYGLAGPERAEELVDILRLVGSADLTLGRLYEGHVNAVALVERYGDRQQAGDLALAIHAGALSAVWAADGAQPLAAERRDGRIRLSGRKILASGAGLVTRPLVTAATADGPLLLLLDLDGGARTELGGWTAQGMRATATGTVDLDGVILAADAVIGQPGDVMRQPFFSGGAWRFCAVHLGAAEQLVDLMRAHLIARGREGDPYQVQRIAGCAAAVGSAGFWIREAARRLADETQDPADTVAFVNMTRMVTERAALDVLEAVHRGVGLAAFMRPHPIERISRDLSTYLRQPVPDLAMSDAGRAVLASPRATGDLWSAL